jgi:hypothetical protein
MKKNKLESGRVEGPQEFMCGILLPPFPILSQSVLRLALFILN